MKKVKTLLLIFGCLIIAYLGANALRRLTVVGKLTELKTTHFIISYRGIYEKDAHRVAMQLEENYSDIRSSLNDPNHEIISVFIYHTQAAFNEGTGLFDSHAHGTSRGPNEFHLLWTNWFNSIVPDDPLKTAVHEFTHCVQLNILIRRALENVSNDNSSDFNASFERKFASEYPQWFWEALCDYEAGIVNKISVKYGMRTYPTLKYLNESNQIYNVGYTIIEYIVAKWGKEKLPELIASYVDIEKVLLVSVPDFEKGWMHFVSENY